MADARPLVVDGASLTVDGLVHAARDPAVRLEIGPEAMERVAAGRREIEEAVAGYEAAVAAGDPHPPAEYGITTGFGSFKVVGLPPGELADLQRRLLLSHCVGLGETADRDDRTNYFPADVVRAALLIRLNAFLSGHSGVRPVLVETLAAMLRAGVAPLVPLHGSLGASGDLAPLAHLFAVLVGEGSFEIAGSAGRHPAADLPEVLGGQPPALAHKEGLALINGTSVSAAVLALALHDAERLVDVADRAAALTVEALAGAARAFDPAVHEARPHPGQLASAAAIRELLAGSHLVDGRAQVQDPYSVRCAPQVHGASRDALAHVRRVVEIELNASTDNPLFFPGRTGWDHEFAANWPAGYDGDRRIAFSAGNFHGQPLALAADFAAIAAAELGSIAERRTQLLLDPDHNGGLPRNLVPLGGLNSGAMVAHYAAAGLVSDAKSLAHPASVDSIPTSANIEDHVSMSANAARKLRAVLRRVEAVLAVELLVAAQGVEWRTFRRTAGGAPLGQAASWEHRREEQQAFARHVAAPAGITDALGGGTRRVYRAVRAVTPPLVDDRPLDAELAALRALVSSWPAGVG